MAIQKVGDTLLVNVPSIVEHQGSRIDCDSTREVNPGDPDYERLLAEYENPPSCAAVFDAIFRDLDKPGS